MLKSDIEMTPLHHRLPICMRAHAMDCFLAVVLYRVMRLRLKALSIMWVREMLWNCIHTFNNTPPILATALSPTPEKQHNSNSTSSLH